MHIFLILSPVIILLVVLGSIKLYKRHKYHQNIIALSKLDTKAIISVQQENRGKDDDSFNQKLLQAGVTLKEYNEGRLLFSVVGVLFITLFAPLVQKELAILLVVVGVIFVIFGGNIFLSMSKSERVAKIEKDLGVFLDLINIILEAGGGLNNAFFEVSRQGKGIIDDELLKEISILEYEMSNYSASQAYENLKKRVGSKDLDKIVDFLLLNEETGIGVKSIFASQSEEMRKKEFYKIKGKANTLNLYLTLIIFIFILPALGAFIIFPLMAGQLEFGLG